jgi:hypothetical protein
VFDNFLKLVPFPFAERFKLKKSTDSNETYNISKTDSGCDIPLFDPTFIHIPLFEHPTTATPTTLLKLLSTASTSLSKIPHFLCFGFDRQNDDDSYHSTLVEIPFEFDVGHFTTSEQPDTFFKLHSFITQSKGRFITYTRVRDGKEWFRCEGTNITTCEGFHSRVVSPGIIFAIYRVQATRKQKEVSVPRFL